MPTDRQRLIERLSRLAAWGDKIDSLRTQFRQHASDALEDNAHATRTASDALARGKGGVLTHRFLKTKQVEGYRLRALAGRPEDDDDESAHVR